jgi:hypothetical protein
VTDLTDEDWQAAKDRLAAAIREFYDTVEPGTYIDDWVLVVHKDSIELTQAGQSVVSTTVPTGQAFYRTTGLLTHAHHAATNL